jgi:hypothetical protein
VTIKVEWCCPKCGADADKHGKGTCNHMLGTDYTECQGFICECDDEYDGEDHGTTFADPCHNANCYHCGWGGVFPPKPKGLQAWEKKALDVGWTPPAKRAEELQTKGKTS